MSISEPAQDVKWEFPAAVKSATMLLGRRTWTEDAQTVATVRIDSASKLADL